MPFEKPVVSSLKTKIYMNRNFLLFKSIVWLSALFLFTQNTLAQCSSSSSHNAGTAASVSFTGSRFGFDIPNNALAADNVYATATAIISILYGPTQNLTLTNFGFTIPLDATICGVVANVKKKADHVNVLSTVSDNSVKLVKGGVVSGNNKALAGNWTTTNTSFTYGGDTDNWGLALTPADVNASNFGVAFSSNINGTISLIPSAQIDNVQLTVYYTLSSLPVALTDFKATVNQNKVLLQWKSEKEINFSHYEIERSNDGYHFEKIATVPSSSLSREYKYIDAFPEPVSYYKLRMVDLDGNYEYSRIVIAQPQNITGRIRVSPNPVKDLSVLHFDHCKEGKYVVEIVNNAGQILYSKTVLVEKDLTIPLSLVSYSKGLYNINVYSQKEGFVHSMKLLRE
jgi:hypothetical protein